MISVNKCPARTKQGDEAGECYSCSIDGCIQTELVFFTQFGWQAMGRRISSAQANAIRPDIVTAIMAKILGDSNEEDNNIKTHI